VVPLYLPGLDLVNATTVGVPAAYNLATNTTAVANKVINYAGQIETSLRI